jgi:hypothetical protein
VLTNKKHWLLMLSLWLEGNKVWVCWSLFNWTVT